MSAEWVAIHGIQTIAIIAICLLQLVTLILAFRLYHDVQVVRKKLRLMGYKFATEEEKQEFFDGERQDRGFDG